MKLIYSKFPAALALLALFLFSLSCDSTSTSFDDAIPKEYSLITTVVPEEGGTVSPENGSFISGSRINLTATASEEYVFDSWEGDIEGNQNPVSLTMGKNYTMTAHFVRVGFPLTLEVEGEGRIVEEIVRDSTSVGEAGQESQEPVRVKLEAIPEEGWVFTGWQGDQDGRDNPVIISRDKAKTITATFEESAPSNFEIIQQPTGTPAGQNISPSPAVKITNQTGEAISGTEVRVSLPNGEFNSESTLTLETDHNGVAEFRNLKIDLAGNDYRIEFEAPSTSLESIQSESFPIRIGSVDSQRSEFSAQNSELTAGEDTELTIILRDAGGNAISGKSSGVFRFDGTENADTDPVNETGEAGIYRTKLYSTVAESLRVSVTADQVKISTDVNIRFVPGSPFSMEKVSGDNQETGTSEASEPLEVRVEDRFGNALTGQNVRFSIVSVPRLSSGANLSNGEIETNQDGIASTVLNTGNRFGQYRVQATTDDLSPVVFTVRARR